MKFKLPNLKKLLYRYPKMVSNNSMEVKLINPDSQKLDEVFGIPIKRSDELHEKVFLAMRDPSKSRATVIAELSKLCNHPNELAYLAMALQSAYEYNQNPLNVLFSKLFSK